MLRARMSGLTDAILRISEDLDVDVVLREVVDSARALTGARYGAIATLDDAGELQDLLLSGTSPEQEHAILGYARGWELFAYLMGSREPLRTPDFPALLESEGFGGFQVRMGAFLGTQIRVRDCHVGSIFIGEKNDDSAFTREDEETLEMFATQAAMAVTNARRYGEEQRAKADLEALVNISPVGVLVVDIGSRTVVMANREARRIVGVAPADDRDPTKDLWGLTCRRIDGSEVAYDDLPVVRSVRRGETVQAEELVIQRRDGSDVTTLVNATPIRPDHGAPETVVATLQDMTPLEDLERLRAEFLAMVSHELRAPLTSIKGAAATVKGSSMPLDSVEVSQFFSLIEDQADHMRDLINDLLDMTRIEAGTLSVTPEPTDLASIIDQARSAFLSGGHRHIIDVEAAPSLPPVWADRRRIVQVLHNLFSNASSHSRDWSSVRVTAWLHDAHVVISVDDEGKGIASEHLPRLFTKFARIDAGEDVRISGHGLGLAICKGIVEAHGGRIWAESDGEGRGTRFTFTIPAVDETTSGRLPESTGGPRDPGGVSRGRDRILVVDDDPQILRYVRNTLVDAGYVPVVTGDPNEVSGLLDSERPRLVLVNLVLPGVDGFELLTRIRTDFRIPVIVLSGRQGQDITKAFERGAADYVVKPFSPAELVARIGAALRQVAAFPHAGIEPYQHGDLVINYLERTVTVAGEPVRLTPTEYKLLFELSRYPGRVLTHDQLLASVWGQDHPADQRLLRSFIKNVRQKLGDDARSPSYIFTQSGVGYRLVKS